MFRVQDFGFKVRIEGLYCEHYKVRELGLGLRIKANIKRVRVSISLLLLFMMWWQHRLTLSLHLLIRKNTEMPLLILLDVVVVFLGL